MTVSSKDEWGQLLADAADRIADARKMLDRDELEECHGYVSSAFDLVRELDHQLTVRDNDEEWKQEWARTWFHEASLFYAFVDALSLDPFLVDGAYKWRVETITRPPLKMPEDDRENRDGPRGEIELACNTASVTLMVRFDSTYNKHVQNGS